MWDSGRRETGGDGVTSRSVEAFQLVILVTLKKENYPGEV